MPIISAFVTIRVTRLGHRSPQPRAAVRPLTCPLSMFLRRAGCGSAAAPAHRILPAPSYAAKVYSSTLPPIARVCVWAGRRFSLCHVPYHMARCNINHVATNTEISPHTLKQLYEALAKTSCCPTSLPGSSTVVKGYDRGDEGGHEILDRRRTILQTTRPLL